MRIRAELSCTKRVCQNGHVTTTDETANRNRLAELVTLRRRELDLSVRAAADIAGIARNTWIGVEDGSRRTADNNYGGIERALKWQTGSIAAVLAGGIPTPLGTQTPPAEPRPGIANAALIRVMHSDMPDEQKAAVMEVLIRAADKAQQQLVEMADGYISGNVRPPAGCSPPSRDGRSAPPCRATAA